ncbi:MAG: hypothetical protein WCV90_06525 [Candidatus Woesearchaeota archaeon]
MKQATITIDDFVRRIFPDPGESARDYQTAIAEIPANLREKWGGSKYNTLIFTYELGREALEVHMADYKERGTFDEIAVSTAYNGMGSIAISSFYGHRDLSMLIVAKDETAACHWEKSLTKCGYTTQRI